MRRAGWAEDEENRRLDCRNETSGQHSLRESVGAGTTGWSSKARERERERERHHAGSAHSRHTMCSLPGQATLGRGSQAPSCI